LSLSLIDIVALQLNLQYGHLVVQIALMSLCKW
jgi:hypothetical protein